MKSGQSTSTSDDITETETAEHYVLLDGSSHYHLSRCLAKKVNLNLIKRLDKSMHLRYTGNGRMR